MHNGYSYNLILLGGTGAKCGESFIHMCANGYFEGDKVNILYIDSDNQNGNAKNFKKVHETYEKCRKRYMIPQNSTSPFQPKVKLKMVDPVEDNVEYFRDFLYMGGSTNTTESAKALMEALYSEEEADMKIADGFFAHPNVGAAVLAANMENVLADFYSNIVQDQADMKQIRIFILGSVFGGTGAASLPTLARYFKDKLVGNSNNRRIKEQVKIGGGMVLPYFSFLREEEQDDKEEEISIEAGKFPTKTRSALEYYKYVDEMKNDRPFDELYILGHDGNDARGIYATMGNEQRNLPHIVELYGAMSAVSFFESDVRKNGYYFATISVNKIRWGEGYKTNNGYFRFLVMMRFAIVMKSLILEELFDYTDQNKLRDTAREIPWYYDFLDGKDKSSDMDTQKLYSKFEDISIFCDEYIRWFAELNLANIHKLKYLEEVDYKEDSDDLVSYLSLFSKEILIKQHHNNQISRGAVNLESDVANNVYQENLRYIRENLQSLDGVQAYTDFRSENITMDQIWSRLCDAGFSSFVLDDDIFKNISKSKDKSMDACVKNLINAVFCTCLI